MYIHDVTTAGQIRILTILNMNADASSDVAGRRGERSLIMTYGDLDRSISLALQHVGCPPVTLKAEQRACIKSVYEGKDVFLWLW